MTFAELYECYARDVFRFALLLSGNRAVAEDITSETFCRALLAKREIREGTVKSYLLAIARNLYRDAVGDAVRRPALPIGEDYLDPGPTPELLARDRVALDVVLEGLQQLPEHERAALVMATQDGLSHEEIADSLGCSVAAVKVRIHRARLKLRLATGREGRAS